MNTTNSSENKLCQKDLDSRDREYIEDFHMAIDLLLCRGLPTDFLVRHLSYHTDNGRRCPDCGRCHE